MPKAKPSVVRDRVTPRAPACTGAKPADQSPRSGDAFIVDNSDEQWKVAQYLSQWCELARALDVATGYFEIGSLLSLDGQWQKLQRIRILMGDEPYGTREFAIWDCNGCVLAYGQRTEGAARTVDPSS
jgi:hypothetical protein